MIIKNNIALYAILTIVSKIGKCSFENMGKLIKKSGDTISRILRPGQESLNVAKKIAQQVFAKKKEVFIIIDETTIKKIYSLVMEGSGWFFDTKIQKTIRAYRLLVAAISDGKHTIPVGAAFTFGKEFYKNPSQSKEITVRHFIKIVQEMFPDKKTIAVLDGAFATVQYLQWAIENNISTEVRMHSNRVIEYKGKKQQLRYIKELKPIGRQMARTINTIWNGLSLEITAVKRIDKHNNETIVFQAATYKSAPAKHALAYKHRWGIEKLFRTTKQTGGLQECFSRKITTQFDHICAVLLGYSILQFEMKRKSFKNPEEASRAFDKKNPYVLNNKFVAFSQCNGTIYA